MKARAVQASLFASLLCLAEVVEAQIEVSRGGPAFRERFMERYALNSASGNNLQWVPDPGGSGRIVMRAQVRDTDQKVFGGIRTEISPLHEYSIEGVRWYAMSVYFPGDWQFHEYPTVVAQLHTSQKATIVSPPVAFVANGRNLDLELNFNTRRMHGSDPATKANSSTQRIRLERIELSRWYCFVVRADWSFSPGRRALSVWVNGSRVYDALNSPNSYETWLGNWPKVGLYVPGKMGVSERTIYTDFIHVGGPKTGYEDIAALTPCSSAPHTEGGR